MLEHPALFVPILMSPNVLLLILHLALGRAAGPDRRGAVAVATELGTRKGALDTAVGGLAAGGGGLLPRRSLPSSGYGITMYVVAFVVRVRLRISVPAEARA
ncbi:MAG: hypothetical protein AAF763_00875 [Pseudomonadota bacterium]